MGRDRDVTWDVAGTCLHDAREAQDGVQHLGRGGSLRVRANISESPLAETNRSESPHSEPTRPESLPSESPTCQSTAPQSPAPHIDLNPGPAARVACQGRLRPSSNRLNRSGEPALSRRACALEESLGSPD